MMKHVLLSRRINLTTRLRVLYCHVWSVLLYTVVQVMKDKLVPAEV